MALRVVITAAASAAVLVTLAASAADEPAPELRFRTFVPVIAMGEPVDPPTPAPPRAAPYPGPVQTLYLGSARLTSNPPVETRDTTFAGGREVFQDPSQAARIAWYPRFGHPGFAGHNSIFAAHINYIGYGNGPFAYLTSVVIGDALYVTMDNGDTYAYTVKAVGVVPLSVLDMDAVVFPALGDGVERVTLISCGGTFVPRPGGGGDYESRVILVAERVHG